MKRDALFLAKMLGEGEKLAERIYELYRQGRMGERSLYANFWVLKRQSEIGALYLVWLLKRAGNEDYEICD